MKKHFKTTTTTKNKQKTKTKNIHACMKAYVHTYIHNSIANYSKYNKLLSRDVFSEV